MNKKRQRIWNKSNGHCWYCGCTLPAKGWHIDHIQPVQRVMQYQRGKGLVTTDECDRPERDTEENMVPTCASCNVQKGTLSVEAFRDKIEHFVDSLNRYHTQYAVAKRYGLVVETPQPVRFWFERQRESEKGEGDI